MSFAIALSGMNAASKDLAITSNNIANANTIGFKQGRAEFADVYAAGGAAGKQVGAGVRLAKVAQQFDQGDVKYTNRDLDFFIGGEGMFTLNSTSGLVYSRAGNFGKNPDGYVVNPAGQRLQVFQPSVTGEGFDTGRMSDLRILTEVSPPKATSTSEVGTTLPAGAKVPATAVFDPKDSTSFNHHSSMTVYDSLGNEHTQTLYYVKTANANEWELHTQIDDGPTTMVSQLRYSDTGSLTFPNPGEITIPTFVTGNGSADMDITVSLGKSVQYGSAFVVNSLDQNGHETGEYTGIETTSEGIVSAKYSNGETVALGQLALSRFNNPQGLQSLGNNAWAASTDSGEAIIGAASTSGFGEITGGALEGSTVNLAEQLINMMGAQRNFQANSQVISTQDQVLQSVINLR